MTLPSLTQRYEHIMQLPIGKLQFSSISPQALWVVHLPAMNERSLISFTGGCVSWAAVSTKNTLKTNAVITLIFFMYLYILLPVIINIKFKYSDAFLIGETDGNL